MISSIFYKKTLFNFIRVFNDLYKERGYMLLITLRFEIIGQFLLIGGMRLQIAQLITNTSSKM